MHPELLRLPGGVLLALCVLLAAWGLAALADLARRSFAAEEPAEAPARRPWDPRDNGFNGAMALLASLALAASATTLRAPGGPLAQLLSMLTSTAPWSAPWRPLPVHSWGALLGCSFALAYAFVPRLARARGLESAVAGEAFVAAGVGALLGARVLYVLARPEDFRDASGSFSVPALLSFRTGGLVAYGGFLGGWLGSWWWVRARGQRFWVWADAATPGVALGLCLTRVGCYLFGCDFGAPLSREAPSWLRAAGTFPRGSPAWSQQLREGFATTRERCLDRVHGNWTDGVCHLDEGATHSAAVHPTQLYESAFGLLLFLVALALHRRREREGTVALLTAALYGVVRALLETLRDDHDRGLWWGHSTSQWLGALTALAALAAWLRGTSPPRPPSPEGERGV